MKREENCSVALAVEAKAILGALSFTRDIVVRRIAILIDCKVLGEVMQKQENHIQIDGIIRDIYNVWRSFEDVEVYFILTDLNKTADEAARKEDWGSNDAALETQLTRARLEEHH